MNRPAFSGSWLFSHVGVPIHKVGIEQIRYEVEPFVRDAAALAIWSKRSFIDVATRIKVL